MLNYTPTQSSRHPKQMLPLSTGPPTSSTLFSSLHPLQLTPLRVLLHLPLYLRLSSLFFLFLLFLCSHQHVTFTCPLFTITSLSSFSPLLYTDIFILPFLSSFSHLSPFVLFICSLLLVPLQSLLFTRTPFLSSPPLFLATHYSLPPPEMVHSSH